MPIVNRISNYIQEQVGLSEKDASIVKYGLEVLENFVAGLFAILLCSWILGVTQYALVAALAASSLRIISGGAHSKHLFNCSLVGAIVSPGIGLLTKYLHPFLPSQYFALLFLFILIIAFPIVWRYAPADTPSKPIVKQEQIRNLKILSFAYLWAWFLLNSMSFVKLWEIDTSYLFAFNLGVLWQIFSLSPWGYSAMDYLDRIIPRISK